MIVLATDKRSAMTYSGKITEIASKQGLCGIKGFSQELIHFKSQITDKGVTHVITDREDILKDFLGRVGSIGNYEGSYVEHKGVKILFIPKLENIYKIPHAPFLLEKYLSKISHPENWKVIPPFSWEKVTPLNYEDVISYLNSSFIVGVDIETKREGLSIDSISWTGVKEDYSSRTFVLSIENMFDVSVMRDVNWKVKTRKVTQNGKYDLSYLARFSCPLYNWAHDTATLFHAMYSELPKDLASLAAFAMKDVCYWKDLANSPERDIQLEYNGRDSWTTAYSLLSLLDQAEDWQLENYKKEFPVNYPAHFCEMLGIKIDMNRLSSVVSQLEKHVEEKQKSLNVIMGTELNVNSPVQMKKLVEVLSGHKAESADAKVLAKLSYFSPIAERVCDLVVEIRKTRKAISTYLVKEKFLKGRCLYALNPHGTDTGRLASKEHHFWCGLQIQNITRGELIKQIFVADDDFLLFECDLEQAESRDTAHIVGDEKLIEAVSGEKDFHSINTSAFFGVPYDQIYDQSKGKTLMKALRDLGKRVNHGANYNMGDNTLVETMGLKKIYEARNALSLSKALSPKEIAHYLLSRFHLTYPKISSLYYPYVKKEISLTKMSKQNTLHAERINGVWVVPAHENWNGWTRRCFGDPSNHSYFNSMIAHKPQNLNAMTLNKAFTTCYREIQLPENNNFKMFAQIHDSILGQVRKGHEHLIEKVVEVMQVPVKVKGIDGKVRVFTVPSAAKSGGSRWSDLG